MKKQEETLAETHFRFPGQTGFYRGKVRDVYYFGKRMAMVASDRISAFDVVLPRAIPHKGAILNQLAAYFLEATREEVPNWLEKVPDPNVSFGRVCQPVPVEMVVRGHLTGHAWRTYQSGGRKLCGVAMPDGMREFDAFPTPILTPTTKASEGHDQDISREEILALGLATPTCYQTMERYALTLFERGREMAAARGLILADSKYEFGLLDGQVCLMDEIHTPDSSRYYYSEGFSEALQEGRTPRQLSKEFVRNWLMERGFSGKEGQPAPEMSDEFVHEVSDRYCELFRTLTGREPFLILEPGIAGRIEKSIFGVLNS